ncbi:hypothetical protein ALC62_15882 [Cyphomyrmex costatus]|uniref:Mos1 transposase HTH domain-containing protein n=1 Tax=Cyphomyrmex costatus TaxID=456900 RepID=A0A195BXY9_9HYME|nr:hypothetical protein ALC62_15882 [Cyphomyrmex costatus]
MEKEQYRSVICCLFLDRKTCKEIKTKLDAIYGNPSLSTITVRLNCFLECARLHRLFGKGKNYHEVVCKWLSGKRFTSNEVIAETKAYFAECDKSYFSEGLKK